MARKKETEVSNEIRDTVVNRQPFEAAIRKLLNAPSKSKAAISAKIASKDRHQPLTKRILEP